VRSSPGTQRSWVARSRLQVPGARLGGGRTPRRSPAWSLEPGAWSCRAQRGSALISAIMVLMVVVGIVAALAPLVRVDVRAAGQAADDQRALYLARAGVNLALATLQQDDPNTDGLDEDWATLGTRGQNPYPLGEGQFRLEVVDASSRLDLNWVDRATLLRLPGIDEATVEEILAWRGQSGANGSASGSSTEYESLPRPYRLKAAPFDSVEELLLVNGVTPLLLYGPQDGTVSQEQAPWADLLSVDTSSPNRDAAGGTRVNLNSATAQQLMQAFRGVLNPNQAQAIVQQRGRAGRFASLADLLSVPGLNSSIVRRLVDHLTLTPGAQLTGKLNVNTASAQALETLPGMTSDVADQLVQRRESEGDFQSVGDLLDLGQQTFRALVDRVTTKSSVFLIRARGELGNGTVRAVEAWVRRDGQRPQVMRWRVVPRTPGWDSWGWEYGSS
jgi:general secretion pathway protein K